MTSVRSAPPVVQPRYLTLPPSVSSAGEEVADLAASAGLFLDPWQRDCVSWITAERADGNWAARSVGLFCPRQNGKNAVIEAIELAALFLFEERLILHSAHEFKTSLEAYLRIKGLVEGTPDLHRQVAGYYQSNTKVGIELRSGGRLLFIARSKSSGRGFDPGRIIYDEAFNLFQRSISALQYSMSAQPNPQAIYTSSAPIDDECSDFLRTMYRKGRPKEDGSPAETNGAHIEYAAADGADHRDRDAWADANPGYPHRINDETILDELDKDPEGFPRERLGIVDLDTEVGEWVIPAEHWRACADETATIEGDPDTFALEVSRDRDWSTFVAAGPCDGRVCVEVVKNAAGTGWVVDWAKKRNKTIAYRKGSQAASLAADLEAAGVETAEVSAEDFAKYCGLFYDLAVGDEPEPGEEREHLLVHRSEGLLDMSVRKAVKRTYSDAYVWDARKSTVDIGPLNAATVAAGRLGIPTMEQEAVVVWS